MSKKPEKKAEEPVIEGGPPEHGEEYVDPEDKTKGEAKKPAEEPAKEPEKTGETTPIYSSAGGEFTTEEELITYTKSLERKALGETPEELATTAKSNADKILGNARETAKEDRDEEQDLADRFITDPAGAIKQLKTEINDAADKKEAKAKGRSQFWKSFDTENQDLQRHEDVVKFIVNRDWDELKGDKDLKRVRSKIAQKTRDFISGIRRDAGEETEITAKGTSTSTGASSTVSTSKSGKDSEKPTSFVEEVRRLRQKRA